MCVCIVNYVLVSNVFTMNKCISIHIWCSSKSVSECVRKIIIYHIILFCRCCCCCSSGALFLFICIYLYFLGFFNLFLFFILCRLFITCGILKTLKRVPSRKFQIVFWMIKQRWDPLWKNNEQSQRHTYEISTASARFSFYLFFIVSLPLSLLLSQSKLQRILFVYINQLLVKQVYFAFKM